MPLFSCLWLTIRQSVAVSCFLHLFGKEKKKERRLRPYSSATMRRYLTFPLSLLLSVQRLAVVESSPIHFLWTPENTIIATSGTSSEDPLWTVSDSVRSDHPGTISLQESSPEESAFKGGPGKLQVCTVPIQPSPNAYITKYRTSGV